MKKYGFETHKSQKEHNDRIGIIFNDTKNIRTRHEMNISINTENLYCGKLYTWYGVICNDINIKRE